MTNANATPTAVQTAAAHVMSDANAPQPTPQTDRQAAWEAMMATPGGTPERRAARARWQRIKNAG